MDIGDAKTLQMMLAQELSGSKATDDKALLMEKTIQLVSSLPHESKTRTKLTNTFINTLWSSLEHPPNPLSRLGDMYQHRHPEGKYNNPMFPEVGQAGTTYARSVTPQTLRPNMPDCGLLFDALMDRGAGSGYREHPNGVSSMLYYIASIVIHDCFRTSHSDFNISTTSSYLDLSPLYGSSQKEQNLVRTFKDGMLKPDVFSEKRLLGFPPGVGVILIMFNRFHNYIASQLPLINEGGRFTRPASEWKPSGSSPEEDRESQKWKKFDEDVFQTARLITGGLYINIILGDYLRTIVGLNRTDSTWSLDPRVDMNAGDEKSDITITPRGCGNQTSMEFNLVYRWHSNISKRDEEWTEDLYRSIFNKPSSEVSLPELLQGLSALERSIPDEPLKREFSGMTRGPDGKYNDDDLVNILTTSIEDLAGASGARNVPTVLRAVEILGMRQSRAWRCATLNEFRSHFGLDPYRSFEDISSDPEVAEQLRVLYDSPDYVELYPGLVCEDAKEPMTPGVGICPTYTTSRAILSDAVTLVRGDRFLTTDYHPANLTAWGISEGASDPNINQNCVFYKLILKAFPNHFKYNSVYAHYPLTTPKASAEILGSLERLGDFVWDRPTYTPPRINVTGYDGVTAVLADGETFNVTWGEGLSYLMGEPGSRFMLSGDGPLFRERRDQMSKCLYSDGWAREIRQFYEETTTNLLKEWGYKVGGRKTSFSMVDVVRDIGNSAHVRFASAIFNLPLKTKEEKTNVFTEHELYMILAVIFTTIFLDFDTSKTFALRKAGLAVTQKLGQLVETQVSLLSKTSFLSSIIDPLMVEDHALNDYGVHMTRQLLKKGLGVHETVWSQILPTAGAMVANQSQVFGQVIDFYLMDQNKHHLKEINRLAKLNTAAADDVLLHYLMEGVRLNGTFGAYRRASKDVTITDNGRPVHFEKGRTAFTSFIQISRDPKVYPNPEEVRLDRAIDSYIVYGIGPHSCLGGAASRVALTAMFKVVGRLDNLRRAPGGAGAGGEMTKVAREGGFYAYVMTNGESSKVWPFPTSMKVCWDGEVVGREDW